MKEQRPINNLHTDSSYVDQPENTTRFVLNGVDETKEGDRGFIANEESNKATYKIPDNYIILEEVSVSNEETVVFSTSPDESLSEIGIVDRSDNYTTLVNYPLGFKVTQQIRATYRLRRGCERTIYWVDPKVRYFNIDRPDQFKTGGEFDIDKFSLFRTYNDIPVFNNIEVKEEGNLPPGSYNFAIQYVDSSLNPTEWITSSPVINIYNDRITKEYSEINGSTNVASNFQNYPETSKSIRLSLSNLDTDYAFYRIAVIESNVGTGVVSQVSVSQEISTQIQTWEYTGNQTLESITEEEIQEFTNIIDEADYIEQIENTLILGDTRGKDFNFCKLQKYASKIKADVTFQSVILNELSSSNSKNPTVKFDGVGYMPGEIYSFGIVYIFEDGTQSPVYHIPGKNNSTENQSFVQDQLIRPMSVNNTLTNTFYTDNSDCIDYWGLDSEGQVLKNSPVRHHRFPSRSEALKPLFEEVVNTADIDIKTLQLSIDGELDINYTDESIDYTIEYTIDGNLNLFEGTINTETYTPVISVNIISTSNDIVVTRIFENNVEITENTASPTTNLSYSTTVGTSPLTIDNKVFTSDMFGIRFSGVDLPSEEEIGGKVVSYYIVRNERTEDNKTVLDTGVITPLLDETEGDDGFFVAHGQLVPRLNNTDKLKTDIVGLIHPEHKFNDKNYGNTTSLVKEGEFVLKGDQALSSVRTEDVMPGTSYDADKAKRREKDSDGFSLHTLTRDSELKYNRVSGSFAEGDEIDELLYLDTLNGKALNDNSDTSKEVYNLSADNKIGIVSMNKNINVDDLYQKLPYVIMKRKLADPYSSFRYLPYYKQTTNRIPFITDNDGNLISGDVVNVFQGDSYIVPMRYTSSMYYDTRLRKRSQKNGLFNSILGVLSIIAGALIIVGTLGLGTPIGIAAIGFGVSQLATGLKKSQMAKVYGELYDAGLKNAVDDADTQQFFGPNPPDDEIQWLADTATNLWFETSVNVSLRDEITIGVSDFLNAPASIAVGTGTTNSTEQNELDSYILEKLTILDSENDNGRLYQGFANAEFYSLNDDYKRTNKQKIFNALGIEYDCCSDCNEEFPNRLAYSEQSFQEELTDNYRVFLPNNYRDIEGEKGKITGLYRLYNNLYVHTEEGLWHLPQNYQERVTNQIVSFLGTGSYFETPARRVVDSEKAIAGTKYDRSAIKTPHGILFVSERDHKIYLFDGQKINAISQGNYNWFKNNMPMLGNDSYYDVHTREYPYLNNPSNPFGMGYITTYDSRKERFIVTKKDFVINPELLGNDNEISYCNGNIIVFENYNQTIQNEIDNGWEFLGINNCELQFSRTIVQEVEEDRQEIVNLPNNVDIHIFYDTSGSFTSESLAQVDDAVDQWVANFASSNPDWTGQLYKYNDSTENWLNYADNIANTTYGGNTSNKDILVISFCNEAEGGSKPYHGNSLNNIIEDPTDDYIDDYNNFINNIFPNYNSFIGIHYPIIFSNLNQSKEFLAHSLAALKGTSYTESELNSLLDNPGLTVQEQLTLKEALGGVNPYPDNGLENFGWLIKENRYKDENGDVITASQFQTDVDELLEGAFEIENVTVTVNQSITETKSIPGTVFTDNVKELDNSWTMSYSLKSEAWVSWHSYIPDFYFYNTDRFFSWKNGNDFIWEHNLKGNYQTFYGDYSPHIIEYVVKDKPTITKIFDWLRIQTEAKLFDDETQDYIDQRFITHNKAILYNTRQNSGLLTLKLKDNANDVLNYFNHQIENTAGQMIIDRSEKDWHINNFRDIVVDTSQSMFRKDLLSRQQQYYIDKVLNTSSLDVNKDWMQSESFRDKFLVVRLIFDNFDNIQLITNYTLSNEYESKH